MQGYEMVKESYEALIAKGKVAREDVQKELEAYDFLSKCEEADICTLANSGAFNDIIKGYCRKALRNAGVGDEVEGAVMDELRWALDSMSAQDVI